MAKEVVSMKLIQDAKQIIESARENAVRSVDFCRVQMYWKLGKRIFEEEQHGKKRADYGAYIVKSLAEKLEAEYGSGFGIRQIERARQFFLLYPIASAVRTQLNWSQYKMLIAISDPDKREYYELEAVNKVTEVFGSKGAIPCTQCRYCIEENHCPMEIRIPKLFSCYNSKVLFGKNNPWETYEFIIEHGSGKPSDCIECGMCEAVCPQHLEIRDLLKKVAEKFEA